VIQAGFNTKCTWLSFGNYKEQATDDLRELVVNIAANRKRPSSTFSRPEIRTLNPSKYLFEEFRLKINDYGDEFVAGRSMA